MVTQTCLQDKLPLPPLEVRAVFCVERVIRFFQRVRALNLVSPVGQVWGKSWDRSIELRACSDTQGPPSDGILTFKPCFPHLRKHHETSLKGTVSSLEPPFPPATGS